MVACCLCGAYEYLHKDRAFHRFPKNKELKDKWLSAIGRKEIYATAKICSNHFDREDYNVNEYNTKRTLLPGTVPHKNLEKKKKKSRSYIDSNIHLAKTNDKSINDNSKTSDFNMTVTILQHCVVTPSDHEYAKRVDYSYAESVDNPNELQVENNGDLSKHSDKHLETGDKLSQKRILNSNISHIKKIRLQLLNKGIFTMTRVNFSSDEAWNAFVRNQILQRKHNKRLQAKNIRLQKRILNLRRLCKTLQNKNYLSKSGSDKIQEIVPPTVQEILQLMLKQKKCQKFSDELKYFATTLHSHSPAAYQYVRNTFLKCLPHVTTLDGKHKNEPGCSKQSNTQDHPQKTVKNRKILKLVSRSTSDQNIIQKKIEVPDDPVAFD